MFLKMRPQPGESTVSYAARLREKAKNCDFHDNDERILEHIIQTTENQELVRKVIYKKWTLKQSLDEMQLLEETNVQVNAMGQHDTGDVAKISRKSRNRKSTKQDPKPAESNACIYYDRNHPKQKRLCPAYGKICGKCGKPNHFAAVCKSTRDMGQKLKQHLSQRKRDIRRIDESDTEESESDTDQDSDFLDESVRHLAVGKVKISKVSDSDKTVPITLNDVIVKMEPDSGADVNVMDEHQYRELQRKTGEILTLQESKTKLSTLQNVLPVSGEFKTIARNKTRGIETKFIVVKGKINSPPLLGRRALFEQGMLDIRPDGSLKEQNELRLKDSQEVLSILNKQELSDLEQIIKQHDSVFHGIGKIFDKKNNEEFLVKFSMKPDATPTAQKPRPVPYYLQEPLRKWLDECVKEEIFERVEPGEPVTWCSPLVVQPKPRYAKVSKEP